MSQDCGGNEWLILIPASAEISTLYQTGKAASQGTSLSDLPSARSKGRREYWSGFLLCTGFVSAGEESEGWGVPDPVINPWVPTDWLPFGCTFYNFDVAELIGDHRALTHLKVSDLQLGWFSTWIWENNLRMSVVQHTPSGNWLFWPL